MNIDIDAARAANGHLSMKPHGAIDAKTSPDLEAAVQTHVGPAIRHVLLDFADVPYLSSAGLRILFMLKKTLTARGGDLLFVHVPPQIEKLFQVVRALPKESIFASVEEADRYFFMVQTREMERLKKGD